MLKTILPLIALASAGSVQAAVVTLFEDDFDSYAPQLGITSSIGSKWTVGGNVDLVTMPNGFGITCSGGCVDLDGTTGPGAISSTPIAFTVGSLVRIQFDLSGSQRGTALDAFAFGFIFAETTVLDNVRINLPFEPIIDEPFFLGEVVGFGNVGFLPGDAPWTTYFLEFTPLTSGAVTLNFRSASADNIGPLIDNVLVTQGVVPEPATWAMLIAGFGLVGTAMRRRRSAPAA